MKRLRDITERIRSDLSDYEAVMLAGLPNAPSSYSLDTNPALAKQRMRQVLIRMIDCNVMTVNRAGSYYQKVSIKGKLLGASL